MRPLFPVTYGGLLEKIREDYIANQEMHEEPVQLPQVIVSNEIESGMTSSQFLDFVSSESQLRRDELVKIDETVPHLESPFGQRFEYSVLASRIISAELNKDPEFAALVAERDKEVAAFNRRNTS